jgi:dynein heavy chain
VDQFDETPFKALRYTTGECNYGGRVTDDKDRRCLHVILNRCYSPDVLKDGFVLSTSGQYTIPSDGAQSDYIDFINQFPLVAQPEIFGMHENATISKDQTETTSLFSSILLTQTNSSSSGEGKSQTEVMDDVAKDIAARIPELYDLEVAQVKYPVKWSESMNTVLQQELGRFNKLLAVIKPSLENVQKAIKGTIVMSEELEKVANSLFFGRVPELWKKQSYPSLKPLAGYVSDLLARLEMFHNWLENKPPVVYWMPGLFFTQAFLTGCLQNFARKYEVPIDDVAYNFEMMPKNDYGVAPQDGAYVKGLFF